MVFISLLALLVLSLQYDLLTCLTEKRDLHSENQGLQLVLNDQNEIYAPYQKIGGQGGQTHNVYGGTNGKILQEIVVWAGEWQIKSIRITLTGDDPIKLGESGSGPTDSFRFQLGETITRLSLWGNGQGSRLGAISFKTNRDNTFNFGMTKWGRKQEYAIDVGSGICVGMIVNSGADIDSAAFIFLNNVISSSIINVRYPLLSYNMGGITPFALEHFTSTNRHATPINWKFSNSIAVETLESWTTTTGVETFTTVSVTSGVPEVVQGKIDAGWTKSQEKTHTLTQKTTKTLSWDESGILGSGQTISLTAVSTKGKISTPYEATMRIVMASGRTFDYPYKGMYEGISVSGVRVVDS